MECEYTNNLHTVMWPSSGAVADEAGFTEPAQCAVLYDFGRLNPSKLQIEINIFIVFCSAIVSSFLQVWFYIHTFSRICACRRVHLNALWITYAANLKEVPIMHQNWVVNMMDVQQEPLQSKTTAALAKV